MFSVFATFAQINFITIIFERNEQPENSYKTIYRGTSEA